MRFRSDLSGHFEGMAPFVHIVVDTLFLCISVLLDMHHHYFWGVDTLITSSGVMAVSSHISCMFIFSTYILDIDVPACGNACRI